MELCGEFYAYRLFPLLDLQYPGSCFIYNTRDVIRWVDSRMNRRNGKYARTYLKRMQRAFEDSSLTMDDLRLHWHEPGSGMTLICAVISLGATIFLRST